MRASLVRDRRVEIVDPLIGSTLGKPETLRLIRRRIPENRHDEDIRTEEVRVTGERLNIFAGLHQCAVLSQGDFGAFAVEIGHEFVVQVYP